MQCLVVSILLVFCVCYWSVSLCDFLRRCACCHAFLLWGSVRVLCVLVCADARVGARFGRGKFWCFVMCLSLRVVICVSVRVSFCAYYYVPCFPPCLCISFRDSVFGGARSVLLTLG